MPMLNQVLNRFETAAALHTAIHCLRFRLPNYKDKPGNKLALEMAIAELEIMRNQIADLGVHEWQYEKEKNKGASTVRETDSDMEEEVSKLRTFLNDKDAVQEV